MGSWRGGGREVIRCLICLSDDMPLARRDKIGHDIESDFKKRAIGMLIDGGDEEANDISPKKDHLCLRMLITDHIYIDDEDNSGYVADKGHGTS